MWTTTPWTLPSNLALAVGDEISYSVFDIDGDLVVLAEARVGAYEELLGEREPVAQAERQRSLVGRTYRPMFDFFADHEGIVPGPRRRLRRRRRGDRHRAHGSRFRRRGLRPVQGRRDRGRLPCGRPGAGSRREVPPYAGRNVFDANAAIRHDLKVSGCARLVRELHPQLPPLLAHGHAPHLQGRRLVVREGDRIPRPDVELNQEIDWIPGHVKDGAFGKWIEQARDWSISRNRFWGAPIPVWKSDDPQYPRIDVYGSLDELERDFGVRPTDLHRPAIDELTRPEPRRPDGRSIMRRTSDVLDCWFESGSMPFAQVHYPVENATWFDVALPRRLHRRVHRPDPRLVLHDARALDGPVRPAAVPELHRARDHPG